MKKIVALALVLALTFGFTGCGNKSASVNLTDDMSQHVNLKWYIRCEEPKGFDEVMAAVNEYLNEKLNATLELVCVQPGDYNQKMQMAFAAQEDFDLVWTSNWSNPFEDNIDKGAYMELNGLLEQVPELKEFYDDQIWQGVSVNGKIYGVPMYQAMTAQTGLCMKKDIVEKYGIDPYNINSFDELTEIYQTVNDNEPGLYVTTTGTDYFRSKELRTGMVVGMEIDMQDNVLNEFDLREEYWHEMKEWNDRGFFPPDILTLTDTTALFRTEKVFSNYSRYLPGAEGKWKINYGYDMMIVPTNDPVINRGALSSTITSVSSSSKNPVRALKLLALTHTDEYLLNLLCYGLEGRDYTKDPDNPKRMQRDSGSYYISEFMIGNQFLAYLVPSYEDDVWEETEKLNKEAKIDPNIGFSFNRNPVLTEITNVTSVRNEYTKALSFGVGDTDKTIEEFRNKVTLAGLDKVQAEVEKQFKEWKQEQKQ